MKSRTLAWLLIPLLLTAVSVEPNADISVELYPDREADVRMRSPGQEYSFSTDTIAWFWWQLPFYWGWGWAGSIAPHNLSANRTSHTQIFSEI